MNISKYPRTVPPGFPKVLRQPIAILRCLATVLRPDPRARRRRRLPGVPGGQGLGQCDPARLLYSRPGLSHLGRFDRAFDLLREDHEAAGSQAALCQTPVLHPVAGGAGHNLERAGRRLFPSGSMGLFHRRVQLDR